MSYTSEKFLTIMMARYFCSTTQLSVHLTRTNLPYIFIINQGTDTFFVLFEQPMDYDS